MYQSKRIPKSDTITGRNYRKLVGDVVIDGERMSTGLMRRDYREKPLRGCRAPKALIPNIPESEWAGLIEIREKKNATLRDLRKSTGLRPLNQNGTNYCWANGVVQAMHYFMHTNNLPTVSLSPASVAAPIKNYRNRGGWGDEAIKYIEKNGICDTTHWPPNAIDRRYDNSDSRRNREQYKVVEWVALRPGSFAQLASCLLCGIPVASGYNWWAHLICAIDLIVDRGEFKVVIDNSWGPGYEDDGLGILSRRKATPDGACAPITVTPWRLST